MSGLAFSPVRATLASCSWDGTLRLWSVFDERGGSDTVQLSADGEGKREGEGGKGRGGEGRGGEEGPRG